MGLIDDFFDGSDKARSKVAANEWLIAEIEDLGSAYIYLDGSMTISVTENDLPKLIRKVRKHGLEKSYSSVQKKNGLVSSSYYYGNPTDKMFLRIVVTVPEDKYDTGSCEWEEEIEKKAYLRCPVSPSR